MSPVRSTGRARRGSVNDTPRVLDWSPRHDERSRGFSVAGVVDTSKPLVARRWSAFSPPLDQGSEGACVGFGAAGAVNVHRLAAAIVEHAARRSPAELAPELLDAGDALELYRAAQTLDEWPGEEYSGTSVLAGMKAAVAAGLVGSYRWAFGTRQLAHAIIELGPAVIGVPWLSGMYATDARGVVQVTGEKVGGHCLAVVGFDPAHPLTGGPAFEWLNSWGPAYGRDGVGVIPAGRLSWLLAGAGEAALPQWST